MLSTCLLLLFFNYGCKEKQGFLDGVIVDLGSPAVDGCGFMLNVNNEFYYPSNLDSRYKTDGRRVKVRFSILEEKHICGFPQSETKFQKIDIRNIKDD